MHNFPGAEKDREIEWKGQGYFGRGTIEIGQEEVSRTELSITGRKAVAAGQTVGVTSMEMRFIPEDEQ